MILSPAKCQARFFASLVLVFFSCASVRVSRAQDLSSGASISQTSQPQGRRHRPPHYSVRAIAGLSTVFSNMPALNNRGEIVGEVSIDSTDTRFHAALWRNGIVTDLGTPGPDYDQSHATAINDRGQISGYAFIAGINQQNAFLWQSGTMSVLSELEPPSAAYGINNRGQISGTYQPAPNTTSGFRRDNSATFFPTGSLGRGVSYARGINSKGAVVGYSLISNYLDYHAFYWLNGYITDLGVLPGASGSAAVAISDRDEIVGTSGTRYSGHAVLWRRGRIIDLGTLAGSFNGCFPSGCDSAALAINNRGQIVGNSNTADNSQHAFLWESGRLFDLNSLIPSDSGWLLGSATGINNRGQIVGQGALNGVASVFLLTPCDEN